MDQLHKIAQVFTAPSAILVPALSMANTEPLKVLIAALGLVIAVLWAGCNYSVRAEISKLHEWILALLPGLFMVCWAIAFCVHVYWWGASAK